MHLRRALAYPAAATLLCSPATAVLCLAILAPAVLPAHASAGVPGLKVLSADAAGVTAEYRVVGLEIDPVAAPAGGAPRVRIAGFGSFEVADGGSLPAAGAWVALPARGGYRLRVLEEETESLGGWSLPATSDVVVERPAVTADAEVRVMAEGPVKPSDMAASLGPETWYRRQRVVALRFHPVRFDPGADVVTVTRRLVVRVEFLPDPATPTAHVAAAPSPAGVADDAFEPMYRSAILNYEQGRAWRSVRRPAAGPLHSRSAPRDASALATGHPAWKVRIDTTGVWRVGYEQLAAQGWPAGVVAAAVTASIRDTAPDLQPVPWQDVEIPIDVVDGNGNSVFDAGDFLVLPVRNWAERTSATWYERRHGDAEQVWISYRSSGDGLRVPTRSGWWNEPNPSVPQSFPSTRRYERQYHYDPVVPDVTQNDQFFWTSGFSDAAPIDSLVADLQDLDTGGGSVTVRARWFGRNGNTHTVSATWASTAAETPLWTGQMFAGRTEQLLETSFPATLASSGANRLRISGSSSNPAGSAASFDWFEVTHPRFYVARGNRLAFRNSGATGIVEFRIDGFSASGMPEVYAYDVTDWGNPTRLLVDSAQIVDQGGEWRVLLQDSLPAAATRSYVVATELPAVPDAAISADTPSSLYATAGGGAEFVILAHDDFAAAVEPLAAFRESQGVPTLVARAQDVYDEFNGGRKSHFAIRRFLRHALAAWNTRAVLLVGDASEDAQGWLGTSDTDYLPAPVLNSPVGIFDGTTTVFEVVPSDHWYVLGLAGLEPIGEALLDDMVVGRWTANDAAGVDRLVEKTLFYETGDLAGPWRTRALLVSDDQFSGLTTLGGGGPYSGYCKLQYNQVFDDISASLRDILQVEAGLQDFDVQWFRLEDSLLSLPRFPAPPCDTSRSLPTTQSFTRLAVTPPLLQRLSESAAFVNFQGYGNHTVLTHEDLLVSRGVEQDLNLIQNQTRPWVLTCFTAHFNNFAGVSERTSQFGDAFGERMVNAAGGGAIVSFSSTAYELLPFNATNHLNNHVYRALFVDRPDTTPVVIGEALALGIAQMVAAASPAELGQAKTYALLGDPLVRWNVPAVAGVAPRAAAVLEPRLGSIRPNPAGGAARVSFTLPSRAARARLSIHDVGGRVVAVLRDGALEAGVHTAEWHGESAGGGAVAPGLYFYRLEARGDWGTHTAYGRFVWLR